MNLMQKMIAAFLLVVLIAVAGFAYTLWKINDVVSMSENLKNSQMPLQLKVNQANLNAIQEIAYVRGYYITKDPLLVTAFRKTASENAKLEQDLIDTSLSQEGRLLATEVKALDEKMVELVEKKFIPLMQAGQQEQALQVIVHEGTPISKALQSKFSEYQERRSNQIKLELEKSMDSANNAKTASIMAVLVVALAGITIGVLFARSLSQPINQLAVIAQAVANGTLTEQVNVNRKDEVGKLALSINEMVKNLKGLVRQITMNSEQIAASSQQLTASSEQSAQASNQIAASIADVASGAHDQMRSVQETSAVVQQMSASIQQVSASSTIIADESTQLTKKAQEGGLAVEQAIVQMNTIAETVGSSAKVVIKLGEQSKEIGQIVDTISGIAGQTNLLALNAAIEAARAGEQGRGFAVVAEEVRKLAEQSRDASKKIAELINEIQEDTEEAVIAMQAGTKEVTLGSEKVRLAGSTFQEIAQLVAELSTQIKSISAAIQHMAAGSQQIVDAVKRIDEQSKYSSAESQSVSAATEQQLASMEEIAAASQALAKLGQDLQTAVSNFRV